MRLALQAVALVLVACACTSDKPTKRQRERPLDPPRIDVNVRGGYERASWSFSVDVQGSYRYSSEGDDGSGTIHWTRCEGQLSADEVRPWFDELAAARMVAGDPDHGEIDYPSPGIVNERFMLTYVPNADQRLRPADVEQLLRLRELWQSEMSPHSEQGKCETGKRER